MGLKTNKATKTSRLNCQYVGSFPIKDGDKKMTISEQNRFVDAKLKNCTKKLLEGMPVILQVSPDGIEVLASDEKTIKMAHTLRRVSYATVEPTGKLFAYVSHQPGTDMKVVCHTFVTKKKDHAEGLSAALGKLFKQTFAYTLKRRDKLEEAAQKRGAGRRWAKQQVAEGHTAVVKNSREANRRSGDVSEMRKENGVTPKSAPRQKQNQSPPPVNNTGGVSRPQPKMLGNRSDSSESDDPFISTTAAVHQSPTIQSQPVRSPTVPVEWETPFVPPSGRPNNTQPNTSFDDSAFEVSWPSEDQPPPVPSRSRPSSTRTQSWVAQGTDVPPDLPSRSGMRRASAPSSPENVNPPPLPKRQISDSSIGFAENTDRRHSGIERKFSAPPDLMPSSPTSPSARPARSSNSNGETSPTHRPISRDMESSAAVLLAGAGDTPPPLPRKGRLGSQHPEIPEEEIGSEEEEEIRREVGNEPRISLTLEDEDWYIPSVSREIVTELLETSDIGTFFVRDSQSRPGCYALTMKVIKSENNPTGFGNYLIVPNGDGFSLQSFDKTFPDISTLIRHYAANDDGLPCRLILAGSNPLFHDANGYLVEFMDEEDDRYASLANCTSMYRELNMSDPW